MSENVPELRFSEFNGEWEEKILGSISSNVMYGMNSAAKEFDGENKYIRITDISENSHKFDPNPLCSPDGYLEDKFLLKEDDLVFARTGASVGKSYLYNEKDGKLYFAGFLIKFHIDRVNSQFIFYQTLREKYNNWVQIMSIRSGQPGINAEEYKKLKIKLTSRIEQQKIAFFLSKVDEKIEKLEEKQQLWETYKKGIIQQIFNQKLRFKDENGEDYPDWEERKLFEFLYEHKEKSSGNEEVFSVSVHKGLINQKEHLGRSFAATNTSKYNLVKPGDVVYTKSPTGDFPLGIIKQSKINKNVIVSPLYGVFSPITKELGHILNVYFESPVNTRNYLHPIVQKGAKNTMNITNETFLSKSLFVPINEQEQTKISNFLSTIEEKIDEVNRELELNNEFKKGLLQKMFC